MAISEYLKDLRARVGPALLVVPSATGLIFDEDGRILLLLHSNGSLWMTPGGAVDPDEAPQDAVVREVWEETGLHVEPTRLRGVFGGLDFRVRYPNGDEVSYVMAAYECRRIGGRLQVDMEEALDARYFSPSDLRTVRVAPWARSLLPSLMDRGAAPWVPPVTWRPPSPGE